MPQNQDLSTLTDAQIQQGLAASAKAIKDKGLDKSPMGRIALGLGSEYRTPPSATAPSKAVAPAQANQPSPVRGALDEVFGTGGHEGLLHKGLEFLTGRASAHATPTHAAVQGHPGLVGQAADQAMTFPRTVKHSALSLADVIRGDRKGAGDEANRAKGYRGANIAFQMGDGLSKTGGDITASLGHGLAAAGDRMTGKPRAAAHHLAAARELDNETREAIKGLIPFRQQVEDYGRVLADKTAGFRNSGAGALDASHDLAIANANNARFRDDQPLLYGLNAGMVAAPFLHMSVGGMRAAASGAGEALSAATKAGDTAKAARAAKAVTAVNRVLAVHAKIGHLAGGGHLGEAARRYVHENVISPVVGGAADHPLGGAVLGRAGAAHQALTAPVRDLFPKGPEPIRPGRQNIADRLSAQSKATRKTATNPPAQANGPIPESTFQPSPEDGLNKSRMAAAGARLPSLPPGNDFEVSKYHSNGVGGHQATVRLHDVSGPISRTVSWKDGDDFDALLRQKFRLPEPSSRSVQPQTPQGAAGATETSPAAPSGPTVTPTPASVSGPAKGTFSPVQSVTTFVPSPGWQEIPQGQPVPPGGAFQMDLRTGRNYGRWPEPPAPPQARSLGTPLITPEELGYSRPVPKAASPQTPQGAAGATETSPPGDRAQGVMPGNGSVSGAPTAPNPAPGLSQAPEVTPEGDIPGPVTQNYLAGGRTATAAFEHPLHRDLFNLGAKMKAATKGRNLPQSKLDADAAKVKSETARIAQETGLTPGQVRNRALDTHTDTSAQMKGVADGETRQLLDAPGRAPDGFEFRRYDTDRRKPVYGRKSAETSRENGGTIAPGRISEDAPGGGHDNATEKYATAERQTEPTLGDARIGDGGMDAGTEDGPAGDRIQPDLSTDKGSDGTPGGQGRPLAAPGRVAQDGLRALHTDAHAGIPAVVANDAAFRHFLDFVGQEGGRVRGAAIGPELVREYTSHLGDLIADGDAHAARELSDFRDALHDNVAAHDGHAAILLRDQPGASAGELSRTAVHEFTHVRQRQRSDTGAAEDAVDRGGLISEADASYHPRELQDAYASVRRSGKGVGLGHYDDRKTWAEVPAHAAEGELLKRGVSLPHQDALLRHYFEQYVARHGAAAARSDFRYAAPDVKRVLEGVAANEPPQGEASDFSERDILHNAPGPNEYNSNEYNPGKRLDGRNEGTNDDYHGQQRGNHAPEDFHVAAGGRLDGRLHRGDPGRGQQDGQRPAGKELRPEGLISSSPQVTVRGKGGTIYANDAAFGIISKEGASRGATGVAPKSGDLQRIMADADGEVDRFRRAHPKDRAGIAAFQSQVDAVVDAVREAIDRHGHGAAVVRVSGGEGVGGLMSTARHEIAHRESFAAPLSAQGRAALHSQLMNPQHPLNSAYINFAGSLLAIGYKPGQIFDELPSWIAGGPKQYGDFGVSPEDAKSLLNVYASQYLKEHGPEALRAALKSGSAIARRVAKEAVGDEAPKADAPQKAAAPAPEAKPLSDEERKAWLRRLIGAGVTPEMLGGPSKPAPREIGPSPKSSTRKNAPKQSGPLTTADLHIPPKPSSKSNALDQIQEVRKAGLISSPRTLTKVGLSHFGYLSSEEGAKVPAAIVDMVRSAAEGQSPRTVLMPHPAEIAGAVSKAAAQGTRDLRTIMTKGPSAMSGPLWQRVPPEFKASNPLIDAWLGGPVRAVGRGHSAAYNYFRLYAFDRAVTEAANLTARHEVSAGAFPKSAEAARQQYWRTNPSTKTTTLSIEAAEQAVFGQHNWLTDAWQKGRENAPAPVRFVMDQAAPITRIPVNLAITGLQYATGLPYSVAEAFYNRAFRKTWGPEEQRRFATTFGRGGVGAALIMAGYWMHRHGLVVAGHQAQSEGFDADHFQPGGLSIDGGKVHLKLGVLAPAGSLFAAGAFLAEQQDRRDRGEEVPVPGEVTEAFRNMTSDQPLTESLDFYRNMTTTKDLPDALGAQAGSFIPTILSDTAAQMDTVKRDKRGFAGEIEGRIPGLRQTLPIRRDLFGESQPEAEMPLLDPLGTTKSPPRLGSPPVKMMLDDLSRNRSSGGYQPQSPEAEEAYQERKVLIQRGRAGEDIRPELARLVSTGKISPRSRKAILKEARSSPEEALFQRLKPLDAQDVFGAAVKSDPALAGKMRPLLLKKLQADARNHPENGEADREAIVRLLGR